MKYAQEYRSPKHIRKYLGVIEKISHHRFSIMEICGGQTHSIVKYGLDQALPEALTLVHGPGCPVCVTPESKIDQAIALASYDKVILCSFGDMMRVPGQKGSLLAARAQGSDIRLVYSPLEALELAERHPDREVVFFAVGFETTAPANAMAVLEAQRRQISNFSLLTSQVLVPPAMRAILANRKSKIDGFLAAGHVCTIMGYDTYQDIAEEFKIPIVITGFEPMDILEGIARCVEMLEKGQYGVKNQYCRVVKEAGNPKAQAVMQEVFERVDMDWRGIGTLLQSGLRLSEQYRSFDAEVKFHQVASSKPYHSPCQAGAVLQGLIKPDECPYFHSRCTPENPMGAPMVSTEGACAAYFQYQRPKSKGS